jgi:hypothetical protein
MARGSTLFSESRPLNEFSVSLRVIRVIESVDLLALSGEENAIFSISIRVLTIPLCGDYERLIARSDLVR